MEDKRIVPYRSNGREAGELRPLHFARGFIGAAMGSCLVECGRTRVICTASVEPGVPPWLAGKGQGWLTAEYAMLPASTDRRKAREGRRTPPVEGRTAEIQRLLGRCFRPLVDLAVLGEQTLFLDCDVIEADGGTRTTAINGAFVALRDALDRLLQDGRIPRDPLCGEVAAVSVGLLRGEVLLDLDYEEDRQAEADINVVMTGEGQFLEVQASAERRAFTPAEFHAALQQAARGIASIRAVRAASLAAPLPGKRTGPAHSRP